MTAEDDDPFVLVWQRGVLGDKRLSHSERNVIVAIGTYVDLDGTGRAFPSQRTLKDVVHVNRQTVIDAQRLAVELGWLKAVGRKGRGGSNAYKLAKPPKWYLHASTTSTRSGTSMRVPLPEVVPENARSGTYTRVPDLDLEEEEGVETRERLAPPPLDAKEFASIRNDIARRSGLNIGTDPGLVAALARYVNAGWTDDALAIYCTERLVANKGKVRMPDRFLAADLDQGEPAGVLAAASPAVQLQHANDRFLDRSEHAKDQYEWMVRSSKDLTDVADRYDIKFDREEEDAIDGIKRCKKPDVINEAIRVLTRLWRDLEREIERDQEF